MPHPSEQRWREVSRRISNACDSVIESILNGEHQYQELVIDHEWAGGSDADYARLLFSDAGVPLTDEMVEMVTDLRRAAHALHELHECMTGGQVAADDRAAKIRRLT